jgi:hypothetical protein
MAKPTTQHRELTARELKLLRLVPEDGVALGRLRREHGFGINMIRRLARWQHLSAARVPGLGTRLHVSEIGRCFATRPELAWVEEPTMDPRDTEQLRGLVERWIICDLWAMQYLIKPRLVDEVFGDGRRLLLLTPIMHRPNRFVIRMDSKQDITHGGEWLYEIETAIEEEYPDWPWAEDYGLTRHEDEEAEDDSRLSFEDGVGWGECNWPQVVEPAPHRNLNG